MSDRTHVEERQLAANYVCLLVSELGGGHGRPMSSLDRTHRRKWRTDHVEERQLAASYVCLLVPESGGHMSLDRTHVEERQLPRVFTGAILGLM